MGEDSDIKVILDHNTVARVINIVRDICGKLKSSQAEEANFVKQLKGLLSQCLFVLGNISFETALARREILKTKIFDIIAEILTIPCVDKDEELIETTAWFLNYLTQKFDENKLDAVDASGIVPLVMTKMLYSANRDTYFNGLSVLVHLTDVRSEKGADMIVKYDESCN